MENEKYQELVLQQLQSINLRMDGLEKSQDKLAMELIAVKTDIQAVKTDVQEVKTTVIRLENNIMPKIGALFDGYSLRGDQIENLRKHVDERLDSIETDTGYLVSKVAKLEGLAK